MGSSSSTSRGSAIRTRAKSRSLRWPPERTPAYSPACPSSLKSASSSAARSRAPRSRVRAALGRNASPFNRSPGWRVAATRMLSMTDMRVRVRGTWNVRTRPRRAMRCGCERSIRRPSKCTRPRSAERKPEITLNNVDLPAPFGPIRAVIDPASTSSDASSTARRPPKARTTSRTSRIAVTRAPSPCGCRRSLGAERASAR